MKAAVVFKAGQLPQYADAPAPGSQNDNELLVSVKAVAIKHLDKAKASGKHYSSGDPSQAKIVGSDGVGLLADGSRIYGMGISGTMAEQALLNKAWSAIVPGGLDDATAAALPNAVMGSALALRFRAGLQAGETVLINGATGFTGKAAVQIARHYGAGKIIVTGRNEAVLQSLLELGADEIISLKQDDETILNKLRAIHAATPFNVILDYIWGHSAELILSSLKGKGTFSPTTRYITIGAMSGDEIRLSSQILRSVDLHLSGSGLGSWTKEQVNALFQEILPEMFQLALEQKLKIDVTTIPLKDIEQVWDMQVSDGKRLVIQIS